ncbi:hypothetical protein NDU88_001081 [Pleurodeles waltl]|uniref:Uncharacterized protein n=1 Tax=Pleurodeles waltl TaxID=8319 RepID=A0AAV7KPC1_PLEWA|nr:hypothetical protein NDU88_001081 [Pleurodeles waltl]
MSSIIREILSGNWSELSVGYVDMAPKSMRITREKAEKGDGVIIEGRQTGEVRQTRAKDKSSGCQAGTFITEKDNQELANPPGEQSQDSVELPADQESDRLTREPRRQAELPEGTTGATTNKGIQPQADFI